MRNDPMEQKLKTAAEHLTPDVLDRILADCAKEPKGEILYMENISDPRSRISGIIGVVCPAAARAVFGADQLVIPAMVLVLAVLLIGRKKL